MDFSDVIKKRRSVREFSSQTLDNQKIDALREAVQYAPTSKNNYPITFYFIKDREIIKQLAKAKQHGSTFLKNAPLAIIIAADPAVSDVWVEDASIAISFLMLQTTNLGLGGCWVQIRNRFHDNKTTAENFVKNTVNIDEHLSVLAMYGIGYPANSSEPENKPHESDVFYIG